MNSFFWLCVRLPFQVLPLHRAVPQALWVAVRYFQIARLSYEQF